MENIVRLYLERHYYIDISEIGNYGIYAKPFKSKLVPEYNLRLIKELFDNFSLDEAQLKALINDWAISKDSKANLDFYWSSLESLLPLAKFAATNNFSPRNNNDNLLNDSSQVDAMLIREKTLEKWAEIIKNIRTLDLGFDI